jgi:hypothetical protein
MFTGKFLRLPDEPESKHEHTEFKSMLKSNYLKRKR